jgi:hypothetical protein
VQHGKDTEITVKRIAKVQADEEKNNDAARPTISLRNVIASETGSFSGWGPKVGSVASLLKNWN